MGSIINWQTCEPEEYGWYLVQIKNEGIRADIWSNFLKCWTTYTNKEVEAWCKTSDIEKYKQE